jgi:thymidylate synthase
LLTIIIAKHCNLKPKELVHFIGDCHIYDNQIEQLKVQCSRKAFNFPKISLSLKTSKIEDINYDDIMLINYKHHDSLNMEMKL